MGGQVLKGQVQGFGAGQSLQELRSKAILGGKFQQGHGSFHFLQSLSGSEAGRESVDVQADISHLSVVFVTPMEVVVCFDGIMLIVSMSW